jgi:hypothetical protein
MRPMSRPAKHRQIRKTIPLVYYFPYQVTVVSLMTKICGSTPMGIGLHVSRPAENSHTVATVSHIKLLMSLPSFGDPILGVVVPRISGKSRPALHCRIQKTINCFPYQAHMVLSQMKELKVEQKKIPFSSAGPATLHVSSMSIR